MARAVRSHRAAGRGYNPAPLLEFVSGLMSPEDAVLKKIRLETPKRGLPPISIGPDEGAILQTLVQACGAAKAVEIGTLAGYSACWIARALPPKGILHTFEFDPGHAAVATENVARAGLRDRVVIHQGAALTELPAIEKSGPFDFCFIDADKANYPSYLRWAHKNLRPGGLAVADNAYLFGKLHLEGAKAGADAGAAAAMRECLGLMADTKLFSSCAMIPTGEGLAVAVRG